MRNLGIDQLPQLPQLPGHADHVNSALLARQPHRQRPPHRQDRDDARLFRATQSADQHGWRVGVRAHAAGRCRPDPNQSCCFVLAFDLHRGERPV